MDVGSCLDITILMLWARINDTSLNSTSKTQSGPKVSRLFQKVVESAVWDMNGSGLDAFDLFSKFGEDLETCGDWFALLPNVIVYPENFYNDWLKCYIFRRKLKISSRCSTGRPVIIAHRGFSSSYPENTILSFRLVPPPAPWWPYDTFCLARAPLWLAWRNEMKYGGICTHCLRFHSRRTTTCK